MFFKLLIFPFFKLTNSTCEFWQCWREIWQRGNLQSDVESNKCDFERLTAKRKGFELNLLGFLKNYIHITKRFKLIAFFHFLNLRYKQYLSQKLYSNNFRFRFLINAMYGLFCVCFYFTHFLPIWLKSISTDLKIQTKVPVNYF